MLLRCGKILVVIALVLTTGLHWVALQTVAWTTMLASNLCTQSVAVAVSDTFDGEHPCPLCKAIAAGKKSEQKSEAASPVFKLEFPLAADRLTLVPPTQFIVVHFSNSFAAAAFAKPLLPPPRSCCA